MSRGPRIVLTLFSAVAGIVMVVTAPPTDNAPGFYLMVLICLLICIACIAQTRVRQFLGSCVGTVLFAASLWYGYPRFGRPAFFDALVFFVVLGVPGLAYATMARFGFWRKDPDVLAGPDYPDRLRQTIPFYNRAPWNLIIGFAALVAAAFSIAAVTTPWIFVVPLVAWTMSSIRHHFRRDRAFRDRGYFCHRQGNERWIYEERQGPSLVALVLPLSNTEPGHWELFIPDDAKWRAMVPEWARDRRREIALRVAEHWKPKDFHLPKDLQGE